MQGIGIGESNFKMLRLNNNYFIDKSLYIKDVIDNKSKVILVTRPRRFGKTLNMSMLKYYFDIREENAKELFNGLKIMEKDEYYTSKLGYYPVIYLSLKDFNVISYEHMIGQMKTTMMNLFDEHKYILKEDKYIIGERKLFNRILDDNATDLDIINSLNILSKMLYKYYEKPVILLIDEYDVPLQTAYVKGYYDEAIDFLKSFYGATFKDNPYLEKTVLTGVSRIAKESIFSGMNNLDVFTIMDNEFADDFGITSEEMKKVISDFNIEEDEEEIKKWYDGYKIGNVEGIYNPWSILNYLNKRELRPYWVNTSSNDLIKMTFKKSNAVKEKMISLLNGEPVEVTIDLETIIVGIEKKQENIWGLMLQTGYLKVLETVNLEERIYKVALPNNEIKDLFRGMVREWFSHQVEGEDLRSILNDLVNLKLEDFERKLKKLVIEMFSYFDVGENTAESFYHAFILGMLVGLKDSYYVKSNRESGYGRYDIMLEPKEKESNSFIMEFKIIESMEEKEVKAKIKEAKEQIKDKKYEQELKERGFKNITKMVFVCNGKEIRMEVFK